MAYLQTAGQYKLPWGGRSPRARRTSMQGAQVASVRAGSQMARILVTYLQSGPLTDQQVADRLLLPAARISARRNALIDRKLVAYRDDVIGQCGSPNGRYELTAYGRIVATEISQAM